MVLKSISFGVQKREMSLCEPGLMREQQQPLVNRWRREKEQLNFQGVGEKTAGPRPTELDRNHKSMWTSGNATFQSQGD